MSRLLEYAGQVLGPCELVDDSSWQHQMSVVLRLRDGRGVDWFLKRHRDRERYCAELAAYQSWVPALRGRAPRLRASDAPLQAMILSAVPGEHARWPAAQPGAAGAEPTSEAAVQREAGTILRRLHQAQLPVPWPDFAPTKIEQFDALRPALATLLTRRDLDAARAMVSELTNVPAPARVPCHHDYTPRNWLVRHGALHVIDFEWSSLDVWVADLARLHLGVWATRPDLREAFLSGYGRPLALVDDRTLRGCAALVGAWLLTKAHETRQRSFEDASRAALLRLLGRA